VTSFISEDLPQPDGPTTATNWPSVMAMFNSSSAFVRSFLRRPG